MKKVNKFEFTSSDRGYSQFGASQQDVERYRQQSLTMFGSVMMPAVIYKGQTFERRVLQ